MVVPAADASKSPGQQGDLLVKPQIKSSIRIALIFHPIPVALLVETIRYLESSKLATSEASLSLRRVRHLFSVPSHSLLSFSLLSTSYTPVNGSRGKRRSASCF
ncbi:hypothetical protein N7453_001323 [Penicillium expansum]|nr:hypothetical protein N7453_001323 [Penicillium expansum]